MTLSHLASLACLLTTTLAIQGAPQNSGRRVSRGVPAQGAEIDIPLVARFDENKDSVLDHAERAAAREYLAKHPELRPPFRRGRRPRRAGTPGRRLTPADVKSYPATVPLYELLALRTLFLEFEHDDWERDLAAFWHTDVLLGATLTMDGKRYEKVGIGCRGNNSFTGIPAGLKRPLSIKMDFVHDQKLLGYRTLNLLNSNQDPTYLRSVLYLLVARDYIPSVTANLVRLVINGECWGIYVNQQTFSRQFEREAFKTNDGTRWKSPNNSTGGGLSYLGEDVARYRRWYEMKGKDKLDKWRALIHVTKVLEETPSEKLEKALEPIMDVDAVLRFLAIDIALVNNDGYWRDGSDFNVYLDKNGRLMLTPHDANEGFRVRGDGTRPDPLAVLDDPKKALRRKLLVVPALRERYLKYVGDIAEKWLDWKRLGPLVADLEKLIANDVARDTRKLDSTEAFTTGIHGRKGDELPSASTLKGFALRRRAALLRHPEIVRARGR